MASFPTSMLVADDGAPESDWALKTAVELALTTESSLSLVHSKSLAPSVVGTTVTATHIERLRTEGQALVDRRVQEVSAKGLRLDHAWVRLGRRVEAAVIAAAEELGSGLLVVGARGRSPGQRAALGDLSVSLVREAPCSVLTVHAERARTQPGTTGARRQGDHR
ncbi:nucleotide-binding universal stress UspA family protein [Lipingzhangella halophila]|uniref:Nucleotide-binding universal stress UspA family protein n=1 Tax=Lipingzhangella halophila TaxID=1783352 RepID=A0A7W7REU3_9ACTN|nr:universal stress protein [Lipingzhangella halophila]MBB4930530.1 nucleotide-binding universal stress UspA family protein [Lipingzhangella halophila]